ncbi:hypothetical protein EMIHUDRAFT_631907 [Emiliania huxleyi CCMP1516]|uniref:Uncharacterized protein n=2 Tax=Emiliania huxleyi TaxID=2903 RepID=A0A0D3KQ13_EMIH1|nr:hypothetical protein EMIHUDRAFT_105966 [Emiliania huxleyi CCMP1516]XP_005790277.1 hypothetical protein EMIHUDRAFT_631907 [Emiliania huxleyi CCMP1516]EOD08675.1 hypothetical protein EMIHUDRAFT_105966 [Emiliania huxleyi CCMP1516]EOD37848.1 hypothetical protein EMIHUDRAFT_631907 [Emiliania huxleyi CCMP1516]|eukprot:XP_005761104.1 hypothetical protein EMIHUDRAFT_105966 [Emiliania huxleyi CCMP1516]
MASSGESPRSVMHGDGIVVLSTHKASAKEQARNAERLKSLLSEPHNKQCFECEGDVEFRTAWASVSIGVFICAGCSGLHRSLGTHISRVKSCAADDWNDDWVDNMESWGNKRASLFWEWRPPARRPTPADGRNQSRRMREFVAAKYMRRAFSAAGEAHEWRVADPLPLENGWARYADEFGRHYFHHTPSDETTWELPDAARPPPCLPVLVRTGARGWLEKKSGGHEERGKMKLLQKWDRRYFVLPAGGAELSYYKTEDDAARGEHPAGSLRCDGAEVFLKEVRDDGVHRFTIKTRERELKLRSSKREFETWASALEPIAAEVDDAPRAG